MKKRYLIISILVLVIYIGFIPLYSNTIDLTLDDKKMYNTDEIDKEAERIAYIWDKYAWLDYYDYTFSIVDNKLIPIKAEYKAEYNKREYNPETKEEYVSPTQLGGYSSISIDFSKKKLRLESAGFIGYLLGGIIADKDIHRSTKYPVDSIYNFYTEHLGKCFIKKFCQNNTCEVKIKSLGSVFIYYTDNNSHYLSLLVSFGKNEGELALHYIGAKGFWGEQCDNNIEKLLLNKTPNTKNKFKLFDELGTFHITETPPEEFTDFIKKIKAIRGNKVSINIK